MGSQTVRIVEITKVGYNSTQEEHNDAKWRNCAVGQRCLRRDTVHSYWQAISVATGVSHSKITISWDKTYLVKTNVPSMQAVRAIVDG